MSGMVPSLAPQQILSATVFTAAGGLHYARYSMTSPRVQGIQISWDDNVADFDNTSVFFSSNLLNPAVPATGVAVDLTQWFAETGIPFTGAAASAAGSEIIHLGNFGARWLLWQVNPTADSTVSSFLFGR